MWKDNPFNPGFCALWDMMTVQKSWKLNSRQDLFTSIQVSLHKSARILCVPVKLENTFPRKSGPGSRQNRFLQSSTPGMPVYKTGPDHPLPACHAPPLPAVSRTAEKKNYTPPFRKRTPAPHRARAPRTGSASSPARVGWDCGTVSVDSGVGGSVGMIVS